MKILYKIFDLVFGRLIKLLLTDKCKICGTKIELDEGFDYEHDINLKYNGICKKCYYILKDWKGEINETT